MYKIAVHKIAVQQSRLSTVEYKAFSNKLMAAQQFRLSTAWLKASSDTLVAVQQCILSTAEFKAFSDELSRKLQHCKIKISEH